MKDEANRGAQSPSQKSGSSAVDAKPGQTGRQDSKQDTRQDQKQGNTQHDAPHNKDDRKHTHEQGDLGVARTGKDQSDKSSDVMRAGEDRKAGRSPDGAEMDSQKNQNAGSASRQVGQEPGKSKRDADGRKVYRSDDDSIQTADAGSEKSEDSSKQGSHSNNPDRSDATRDQNVQTNPDQASHKR